jgi:benzylsuccinate CoA-transferase BbsF subunit
LDKLPLEGIRVTDFTAIWAGAHITQWLGVMGADVIKIESNLRPDGTRVSWRPGRDPNSTITAEFACLNYGKKACTLNMTLPRARELAKDLIAVSDIVAENFGGAVMDRWGMGYSDLVKIKPDIIMYSGSGFGRTGPYKELPAFAGIVESFGGLLSLNGYPGGQPSPMCTRGYADILTADHGTFAILAALYHRSRTGHGQYIDLSMSQVVGAVIPEAFIDYTMNGRVQGPQGNRDSTMAPHGCYRCQGDDEWVTIAVSGDDDWRAFCDAIGNPEWTGDARFRDGVNRRRNQDELDQLVQEWTKNHTHHEATEILQRAGVMAAATVNVVEGVQDRHLTERGFFRDMDYPGEGNLRLAGMPWRLSDVPEGNYQRPPALGEHNDYVFKELLKMSDEEIAQLQEEQVIY